MTTYCPRCGDRTRGYSVALPFLVWTTCQSCSPVMRGSVVDTLAGLFWRLLGKPRPVPISTGVTVLPLAPTETYEFLAPATSEPASPDVVDQWLAGQEDAPTAIKGTPDWDLDGICEPKPARETITLQENQSHTPHGAGEWDGELHLFLGEDSSPADAPKNRPTSEEWPVDLALDDEWSVSRLVH